MDAGPRKLYMWRLSRKLNLAAEVLCPVEREARTAAARSPACIQISIEKDKRDFKKNGCFH